jgi:DNA-binding transcriptional LysR family regulator
MIHDDDPVDLRLLMTFEAVVRHGSVTAAAKELGRTQSAISHRIHALEDDLGVPVFERRGPRLFLTNHGERLRVLCADLVGRSKHIRSQLAGNTAMEGRVTIGTHQALASRLFPGAIEELLRDRPRLRVDFEFGFAPRLLDGLRSGQLDFVISGDRRPPTDLDTLELGPNPLVAALPPGAQELPGEQVAPEELRRKGGRYIAYGGPRDTVFDEVARFSHEHRLVDEWCPRVPSIEGVRALVELGAGYSLLPEYAVRREAREGKLRIARVQGLQAGAPLLLFKRRTAVRSPALDLAESALRDGIEEGLAHGPHGPERGGVNG